MINKPCTSEIIRNLLGCLEVALFMPVARTRFGDTAGEALRSFLVPVILFPLTVLVVYFYPEPALSNDSLATLAILYSLRMGIIWTVFFGTVYWIAREIDRKKYFYQFVTASNWLTIPATIIFAPVAWMLFAGTHTWAELYPFMMCLMVYTYAFTAFMASYVLRVPWELAGFIVFVSMALNDHTLDLLYWVGDRL